MTVLKDERSNLSAVLGAVRELEMAQRLETIMKLNQRNQCVLNLIFCQEYLWGNQLFELRSILCSPSFVEKNFQFFPLKISHYKLLVDSDSSIEC